IEKMLARYVTVGRDNLGAHKVAGIGLIPTMILVANSLWNSQEDFGTTGARRLREDLCPDIPLSLGKEHTACHYSPKPPIRSPKKPSGWPVRRSHAGPSPCRWPTVLALSTKIGSSAPSSPAAANQPKRRRVWRSPRSSHVRKVSPTAKLQMPSAAALIGNTSSGWT